MREIIGVALLVFLLLAAGIAAFSSSRERALMALWALSGTMGLLALWEGQTALAILLLMQGTVGYLMGRAFFLRFTESDEQSLAPGERVRKFLWSGLPSLAVGTLVAVSLGALESWPPELPGDRWLSPWRAEGPVLLWVMFAVGSLLALIGFGILGRDVLGESRLRDEESS